jgi:urease accessory protein
MHSAIAINTHTPGWQAELRLRFGTENGDTPHLPGKGAGADSRTRLLERRHKGPLVIQRPFHPEGDPCHVYVVHPPGGVVGGDELRIDVQVDPGAHALITTPAATKFYRCANRASAQTQELRAAGATLEWLPQENIFYRGADARTATRVFIDAASKFIGWEIACLGLPARGELFDAGKLHLDLELWRGVSNCDNEMRNVPIFIDRLRLAGEARAREARWGLGGHTAVGTLLATPATEIHRDRVRELCEGHPHAAVSLVDGALALRALAAQAESIRKLFIDAWHSLRPAVIGREAVPPRIWAT